MRNSIKVIQDVCTRSICLDLESQRKLRADVSTVPFITERHSSQRSLVMRRTLHTDSVVRRRTVHTDSMVRRCTIRDGKNS